MRDLFRRIAVHAGLTALFLGIVGLGLAQVAATTMLAPPGGRTPPAQTGAGAADMGTTAADLRTTIPLSMAIWGFVIVTLYEVIKHLLRGGRATAPAAPSPPQPDETEKLLEQLLSEAESKSAIGPAIADAPAPADNAAATSPR
jgi:hypothetical protein